MKKILTTIVFFMLSCTAFSQTIDLGFPLNIDLEEMVQSPFGEKFLLAPFYAYDGMNEYGLCAAVAGIGQVRINEKPGKDKVFITYLIRKILDQTKTVDEAVKLVEEFVPFDLDEKSLNAHFLVADSTGKSVILEYNNDEWVKTYPEKTWQVMTNKVVFDKTHSTLKEKCWRYKSISEMLEKTDGIINWKIGLQMLKDVSQNGTTWSVIYSPATRDIYFSVYQTWNKIYHIQGF